MRHSLLGVLAIAFSVYLGTGACGSDVGAPPPTDASSIDATSTGDSSTDRTGSVLTGIAVINSDYQWTLVSFDRASSALTWLDPTTCAPLGQLAVDTGFASYRRRARAHIARRWHHEHAGFPARLRARAWHACGKQHRLHQSVARTPAPRDGMVLTGTPADLGKEKMRCVDAKERSESLRH